jgi:hypothetical protein
VDVALSSDEPRLGVIGLSNDELAGSLRKTLRRMTIKNVTLYSTGRHRDYV